MSCRRTFFYRSEAPVTVRPIKPTSCPRSYRHHVLVWVAQHQTASALVLHKTTSEVSSLKMV